jgi:GBP family porin
MKKTFIAAAVLGSVSTLSAAQSSVTLYGLVDAGIAYTNNQGGNTSWQLRDGNLDASRWGVVGSEDLGGGRKAVFQLENGFNVNNGKLAQDSRLFGRQAFVGVADNTFGSVTLGRQYDSVVDFLAPFTETGGGGALFFAHPYDNDNTRNSFRINNSVKYKSPVFAGFSFGGVYGFSNQAGGFGQNRAYSIGASYQNGPLKAAAAYMELSHPGSSTGAVDTTIFVPGTVEVPGATSLTIDSRQRTYGVGASYDVGPATIRAIWTHTSIDDVSISADGEPVLNNASAKFDNYEINGRYHLTAALALDAMYTYTQSKVSIMDDGTKAHWHTLGLQSTYALSKRTDLYLAGVYQKASSGVNAQLFGSDESSTDAQFGVTAGVRHRF